MGPKGGRREKHPRRRIVDAIFQWCGPVAPGGSCRRTSLLGPRCTGTSRGGMATVLSNASTTRCGARSGRLTVGMPSRARG
nr:hypothetical protein [Streptomyces sp. NRRL S-1824]